MTREKDGEYILSVSDPTWKLDSLKIAVDRNLELVDSDVRISSLNESGKTVLNIDLSEHIGRTYEAHFNIKQ